MLAFRIFDPKVGKWLADGYGEPVYEKLQNTILENLFPKAQFSFALVDDQTNPADLQNNHPAGHKLLFSSGSRFVFGSPEQKEAMETIFPEDPERGLHGIKDRGAYGALLIGDCDRVQQPISVLTIDRTGTNQAGIEPALAVRYAENSAAQIMTGTIPLEVDRLILFQENLSASEPGNTIIPISELQQRIGVNIDRSSSVIQKSLRIMIVDDKSGENGGFLPKDIARQLTGDCHGRIAQDLARTYGLESGEGGNISQQMMQFRSVLPDFDNSPSGQGTHKIAKGTLLGQNLEALPWQLPAGQSPPDLILATSSFKGATKPPVGLHQKEIWLGAKSISATGKMSISSLLPLYPGLLKDILPRLEPKMAALAAAQNDPMSLAQLYIQASLERQQDDEALDNSGDSVNGSAPRPDSPELKFVRAAVESGNSAALQSPLAVKELQKFVKNEWKSLALGQDKSIAFDRAMALPDKKLANGEICVPWLPDGEEIIVYRPPLINTNGVHILTNQLAGALPYQRAAQYIAISDALTSGRSVMGDMALDFDGDHVALARALDYPNLARAVKLKQQAADRYPDLIKEQKQEFAGVSQEAAALQMARSPVGLIANALIAVQSEISAVETLQNLQNSWIRPEDTIKFGREVQQTMAKVLAAVTTERPYLVKRPNNLSEEGKQAFSQSSTVISNLARGIVARDSQDAQKILGDYNLLLREVVAMASSQNQIAVDMPKSARKADEKAIADSTKFLAHKSTLQQAKKLSNLYITQVPTANGISPPEILVATVNQYFVENKLLQARPSQFKGLFEGISYSPQQKAIANGYQEQFQKVWIEASGRLKKEQNESGVSMELKTGDGRAIDVVNLHRGKSEVSYTPQRITKVTIQPRSVSEGKKNYHRFEVLDGTGEKIGDLCELSARDLKISQPLHLSVTSGELKSRQELSSLYFTKAREIATQFANRIPPADRPSYGAALWAEATKETDKGSQQQTIPKAILYAFPDELAAQVCSTNMNRVHVKLNTSAEAGSWDGVQIFKAMAVDDGHKVQTTLYSAAQVSIGHISQMGYPLRPGVVEGTLTPGGVAVLQLDIPELSQPLTIGKVNEFAWAGQSIERLVNTPIRIVPVQLDAYRLAINGKTISDKLSQEAADFVVATGLNNGQPFRAAVISREVNGERSALYLNFEDGSMIQCVATDKSLQKYQGEDLQLSIVNSPQYTAGVFVDNKELGQTQQIGEFTMGLKPATDLALNPKESLDLLVEKGLLQANVDSSGRVDRGQPLGGVFTTVGTISSDGSNQILEVTAQDFNPPVWQLIDRLEKSAEVSLVDRLRAYNAQKSPVMLVGAERCLLAVDESVGVATAEWLGG
jgi:hypothetical protein